MSYLTRSAEDNILETKRQKEKFDSYLYYCLIFVVSILSLTILPMLGSELPVALQLPKTAGAWVLYIFTKLMVAFLNVLIFHCFMQQGDTNVRYYYKRRIADEVLSIIKVNDYNPLSPEQWKRKQYSKKGVTIAITSVVSAFCIAQAVLSFDWNVFISYVVTVLMGLLFGILQMKKTEMYYSGEYFDYAVVEMKAYNKKQELDENKLSILITSLKRQVLKGETVIYDYYQEFPAESPEKVVVKDEEIFT